MQTRFTPEQLTDPDIQRADAILRRCVHCGFCLATCPTYVLRPDERESPRGRIYLIKDLLEAGAAPAPATVEHIDSCLGCNACMTTCPSDVDYLHLVDLARARVETDGRRSASARGLRWLLSVVLPRRGLFRWALRLSGPARLLGGLLPRRLAALVAMAPRRLPAPSAVDRPGVHPPEGVRRMRVALLSGCVQPVVAPSINEATVRLLTRLGVEVVIPEGAACCGSLVHHMGMEDQAVAAAARNVDAWWAAHEAGGLDHIVINAAGCGTTVKDYGTVLRHDRVRAERARILAEKTVDIAELLAALKPEPGDAARDLPVAYHAACSIQHGQRITEAPRALLAAAGCTVSEPVEAHLCCGSAGAWNLLHPEPAAELGRRKADHLKATGASVVVTGNVGCMVQIEQSGGPPVVHLVELMDWACGGPKPAKLDPV